MRRLCILVLLAFLISACGQKGPLYLPKEEEETQKNRRRNHREVSFFSQRNGALHAEDVPLSRIAEEFGTPCYVYSRAALTDAFQRYDRAFGSRPHLICYAVKANSNLAILNLFARLGSGFDIVSGGELARVIAAGGDPGKTVFSGVGKTEREMRDALAAGILCFNVESESELLRLERIAGGNRPARAGEPAGESGCRRQDTSLHFHRPEKTSSGSRSRTRCACIVWHIRPGTSGWSASTATSARN